jgi:hypothetical protein
LKVDQEESVVMVEMERVMDNLHKKEKQVQKDLPIHVIPLHLLHNLVVEEEKEQTENQAETAVVMDNKEEIMVKIPHRLFMLLGACQDDQL